MKRCVRMAAWLFPLFTLPFGVLAQESPGVPPPGTRAISVAVPEGGGSSFSVRKILDSGANLGINVRLGASWSWTGGDQQSDAFQVGIGPDVRLYRDVAGPVVPFLELGGDLGYRDNSGSNGAVSVGASLALGAEWFVRPQASLSASTGIRSAYDRTGGDVSSSHLSLGAFRSQLLLNLYF